MLGFWGVALILIAMPGPDWAFVIAAGIGARVVLPAVGGLMIGYSLITAVVAAGLGAVVAGTPFVLSGLTVAGAAYLAYLGIGLLRRPSTFAAPEQAVTVVAPVLRGIGVSGLNPKGLLIFLALLPQFTDPGGSWPVAVQLAALGLVFVLTCGGFYVLLGLGARGVLRTRPATARIVSRVSGAAMVVIAVLLLLEHW